MANDALIIEEINRSIVLWNTLICNGPIIKTKKYETVIIIIHMTKISMKSPNNLIMIISPA